MKVLLDECADIRLADAFSRHEATTVVSQGWAGKKNGELIALADQHFQVLVTTDRNLVHQQNLQGKQLIVVTISTPSNSLTSLAALIPRVEDALDTSAPGTTITIQE